MSLILVHSPKGGVGATTIAANLALGFARRGSDVAAVDLTGQDTLGLHLGMRPDYYGGGARADEEVALIAGVQLLSSGQQAFGDMDAEALLAQASAGSIVIANIAAADRATLALLMPRAALRLAVLTPEPAAIALVPHILSAAGPNTRFVVNRIDERLKLTRDAVTFLRTLLEDRLIGFVRRDEALNEALAMIEPLCAHMPASGACSDLEALVSRVIEYLPPEPGDRRDKAQEAA